MSEETTMLSTTDHPRLTAPRRAALAMAIALVAVASLGSAPASAEEFGVTFFDGGAVKQDGTDETQAGAHPYKAQTEIQWQTAQDPNGPDLIPAEGIKYVHAELPAGFIGNPTATPKCPSELFNDWFGAITRGGLCPRDTQVGQTTLFQPGSPITLPVYNLEPAQNMPARFGFRVATTPVVLVPELRSDGDYGINVKVDNVNQSLPIIGSKLSFWGVPNSPLHDFERAECTDSESGLPTGEICPVTAPPKPFLTNPTDCSTGPLTTTLRTASWLEPEDEHVATFTTNSGPTGCDLLEFEPEITVAPKSPVADAPSGYDFEIEIPQDMNPDGLATPALKKSVVKLPDGLSVNTAAADGLDACAPDEIKIGSRDEPECPAASKIGEVTVDTPLLDDPLHGEVYVKEQTPTQLLGMYLVIRGPGILVKQTGNVNPNLDTGQLEATFDNAPQLPFGRLHVELYGGQRAPLANPGTCGTHTVETELTPFSAAPQFGTSEPPRPPATPSDSFEITTGPNGLPCVDDLADRPFAPGLTAGLQSPVAGSSSPFSLKATRADGHQELKKLDLDMPPGLTAKLAGIPYCSESELASISGAEGTGRDEIENPSCPAESRLGSATVGVGAGSSPHYVDTGRVYLAGPYDGAPLSLAVVTPAVAGPFDLGTVVVRSKLRVDRDDAQVHAETDQIPHIISGIPLRIRDIRVKIDRPGFMQAPTNCDPMAINGSFAGAGGLVADPADDTSATASQRFQVGECRSMDFGPKLSVRILNGADGIHRSDHPNMEFVVRGTPGHANIRSASVALPPSIQIDQGNLGNICSETQLANERCAGRQQIGTAIAHSPLLGDPLQGAVYAVSGSGGLPRLAVLLDGPPAQPISLLLRGDTTTAPAGGGTSIVNTFAVVPDAPVTEFKLTIDGGPAGYLVNNTNLCAKTTKAIKRKGKGKRKRKARTVPTTQFANASFTAQNGDSLSQRAPVAADCGPGKRDKGKKGRKGRKRRR